MSRQVKLMILVNILLGLSFVLAGFVLELSVNDWMNWWGRHPGFYRVSGMTPFSIQLDVTEPVPIDGYAHIEILNYPFYVFWLAIAVNLYLIIRLGRNKASVDIR